MSQNKILHLISNETKSSIDQMEVVTPSVYASIFSTFAQQHNEPLEDEHELSVNLLQAECQTLTSMQSSTSKSAKQLTESATKAITAIKEKDKNSLEEVLLETQALRHEIEKLKTAVYTDELTHAYNRKYLNDTYLKENTTQFNSSGILTMIDLNYFKQVNDTHGHVIGDKVLVFIANKLKLTRHRVIRYGGDEFMVMFEGNTSIQQANRLLNKVREDVISKQLKAHQSKFTVSFSFGSTPFKEGDELTQIIQNADKIMYDDKILIKKRVTGI